MNDSRDDTSILRKIYNFENIMTTYAENMRNTYFYIVVFIQFNIHNKENYDMCYHIILQVLQNMA